MSKITLLFILCLVATCTKAQDLSIDTLNFILAGIPPVPLSMESELKPYSETRGAMFLDWSPKGDNMIISTRFGNTNQIHLISQPLGLRKQLTFDNEPINMAIYDKKFGQNIYFQRDNGGDENSQICSLNLHTKNISQVTASKNSVNNGIYWLHNKNQFLYQSTKRNGSDRDFYLINPDTPQSERLVISNKGGGWSIGVLTQNDSTLFAQEYISVTSSRIFKIDMLTGDRMQLIPSTIIKSSNEIVGFGSDKNHLIVITDQDAMSKYLAKLDLKSGVLKKLASVEPWDIENASISPDQTKLIYTVNVEGYSDLYVYDLEVDTLHKVNTLPNCIISDITWNPIRQSCAITYSNYRVKSDVIEYFVNNDSIVFWTQSEIGGMNLGDIPTPELIRWSSFDHETIPGFLYRPPSKFKGKRPVIIQIHGGPESQSRPGFLDNKYYFINELGVAYIYPNVRGSVGYGKRFTDLDNGFLRENSVKDIGALIEWISTQKDLDENRIMIAGGSYGGFMTAASAVSFNSKIRCAIDLVGISNFNSFLRLTSAYRRDLRRAEYGDEREFKFQNFFEKISPLNHTEKITKPFFIVQGANDPRVPKRESIQLFQKLNLHNPNVWFYLMPNEGHGIKKKENIDFVFYSTVLFVKKFLIN